jgi:cytochrome c-type biogenesis protein CcmH
MNLFIGIAALLTLLVVAWLVRPLLVSKIAHSISSNRLNTAIHRDQLAALEADLVRGVISQQDFEATRDELQLRLLDDTESFEASPVTVSNSFWSGKRTALALGLSVPVLATGLYLQLGTPAAVDPVATAKVGDQQIRQMIDTLAERLKANPDNPKGWAMLARSYKAVERFDDAAQAFEKAGDLVNKEPDLLVDYADVLAVKSNGNLEGKPMELVNKALAINPDHLMGLMIKGVAAYRRSDFKQAITQWEKLLTLLEPGSPDAQQIEADIADARTKAGLTKTPGSALIAPPNKLGAPAEETGKLPPVPAGAAAGMTPEMINQMVDRLAARLKDNPDDVAGWARLARAYKVQGRTAEAEQAYARTGKLLDTDPDLMMQYADLLATRTKGDFKGKPLALINKALSIAPKHPMALMLAGQAAYQVGDYGKAIGHWETVLTVLPAGSEDAKQVKSEIAQAKAKMATKK